MTSVVVPRDHPAADPPARQLDQQVSRLVGERLGRLGTAPDFGRVNAEQPDAIGATAQGVAVMNGWGGAGEDRADDGLS